MLRKVLFTLMTLTWLGASAGFPMFKKDKKPEVSLVEYIESKAADTPDQVDGVKIFLPGAADGDEKTIWIKGSLPLKGNSATQAFAAAFIAAPGMINPETDEISDLNVDDRSFVINRVVRQGEYAGSQTFRYPTLFTFEDGKMNFTSYDILVEYKEKGILPRKIDISKLKPATNSRHAELLDSITLCNSRFVDNMQKAILNADKITITHWPEIKEGRVVKGMNPAEVRMIGGIPRSENKTGNRIQWMFSNDFIVIFENGVVVKVLQ